MNIEKKYKVIDTVFFEGEIDYLLFRFTELSDSVDFFIVLESLSEDGISSFENHKEKFSQWKDKIIYIKTVTPSEDKVQQLFESFKLNEKNKSTIIPIKIYKKIFYGVRLLLDRKIMLVLCVSNIHI